MAFNLPLPPFIPPMFDPSRGSGWNPQNAPIDQPFNAGTAQGIQGQVQDQIGQQQAFVNALQGQNGVGNQGYVFSRQNDLANMLQNQAAGNGPNPALSQLQETSNQNANQTAAMMAGQRGAGANPALLAKHIADQRAAIQQQANAQAATLRAQQQLGAQSALQGQLGQMGGMANQMVGQQQGAMNSLANQGLTNQGQVLGSIQGANQAQVSNIGNQNQTSAGIAQGNQQAQQGLTGGLLSAAGRAIGLASGGAVPPQHYFVGEMVQPSVQVKAAPATIDPQTSGPQSNVGQSLSNAPSSGFGMAGKDNPIFKSVSGLFGKAPQQNNGGDSGYGIADRLKNFFVAGNNPFISSSEGNWGGGIGGSAGTGIMADAPEAGALDTAAAVAPAAMAARGGQIGVGSKLKSGGGVPGKAKVKGDSLKNDTVNAKLSPGEIVIPRSITQSKDAPKKAAEFVAAILARKGR